MMAALLVLIGCDSQEPAGPDDEEGIILALSSCPSCYAGSQLDDIEDRVQEIDEDMDSDCAAIKSFLTGWIAEQRSGMADRFLEDFGTLGVLDWGEPHGDPSHYPRDMSLDDCVVYDSCESEWMLPSEGGGSFNPSAAWVLAHEAAHALWDIHDEDHALAMADMCAGGPGAPND